MKKNQNLDILKPLFQLNRTSLSSFNQNDFLGTQVEKLCDVISNFSNVIQGKFQNIDKVGVNKKGGSNNINQNCVVDQDSEPRFTYLKYPIQDIKNKDKNEKQYHMKIFSSDIARKILTKGFKWFQEGKIDEKKLRHFFCNNFLCNIVRYCCQNNLKQNQIKEMDSHLKKNVFTFLQQKYPQNQNLQTNSKLDKMITLVDNYGQNSNDLVYMSGIKFEYKENKDYSKQIMKFINYVITLTRKPVNILGLKELEIRDQEDSTLFSLFYKEMDLIFQRVFNQQWALKMQNNQYKEAQQLYSGKMTLKDIDQQKASNHQKYKKRVKQYTKYVIGQKISHNILPFSEADIEQQNLRVNNPSIMRILTKWCEELQKNFEQVNITSRGQRYRMSDGSERNLKKQHRNKLYVQLNLQKKVLQNFVKQTKDNIYQNQRHMFKDPKCLYSFRSFASEDEGIAGYFATVMKQSYQNYLISYLNQLIHCILSAQQNLKQKFNKKQKYKVAVNLISFKVGDLLRCKCSSKQSQIVALYNYLRGYCRQNKQKLQIIRVKNRLSQSTKDILINLKFHQKIIVQMQLSINQETSTFIKCSSMVKHFLYQIQRATFGPIIEICNIYSNVDPRAEFFRKKFQQQNRQKLSYYKSQLKKNKNTKQEQKSFKSLGHINHNKISQINFPIWCSHCKRFVSTLNLIKKHNRCNQHFNQQFCQYRRCAGCIVRQQQKSSIQMSKEIFKKLMKNSISSTKKDQNKSQQKLIRQKAIIVDLQKKRQRKKIIYLVYFNFKIILFQQNDDDDYCYDNIEQMMKRIPKNVRYINQAGDQTKFIQLFEQKLILSLEDVQSKEQNALKKNINNQILKKFINFVRRRQRKQFVFQQIQVDPQIFSEYEKNMELVETVMISNLSIPSTKCLVKAFPNAKVILINKNKIQKLQNMNHWKKAKDMNLQGNQIKQIPNQVQQLQQLSFLVLSKNQFQEFPENLCKIRSLQSLNFKQNFLVNISPKIQMLTNLKHLRLNGNKIKQIPNQISGCLNLVQFDVSHNKIEFIPQNFKDLQKLKKAIFQDNQIKVIQQNLFEKMSQIYRVDFCNNQILKIPFSLSEKESLSVIDFTDNCLVYVPPFIFELKKLQQMSFTNNEIDTIEIKENKTKLKKLYFDNNLLNQIPSSIFKIKTIQRFKIGKNKQQKIPKQISSLPKLKQLFVQSMQLMKFPEILLEIKNLQILSLNDNNLKLLPDNFAQLACLKQLHLSKNDFQKIPKCIFSLEKLQTLNLSTNRISQVPKQLAKLQKLQKLKLQGNFIKEFPEVLFELPQLQQLTFDKIHMTKQMEENIERHQQKNPRLRIQFCQILKQINESNMTITKIGVPV